MTQIITIRATMEAIWQIPRDECGVYYFYDKRGNLMYVGKASNLFHRIRQHFDRLVFSQRSHMLMARADDIDVSKLDRQAVRQIMTRSIVASLIQQIEVDICLVRWIRIEILDYKQIASRETELIYALDPPYNVESNSLKYYARERLDRVVDKLTFAQVEKDYQEADFFSDDEDGAEEQALAAAAYRIKNVFAEDETATDIQEQRNSIEPPKTRKKTRTIKTRHDNSRPKHELTLDRWCRKSWGEVEPLDLGKFDLSCVWRLPPSQPEASTV